MTLQDLVSRAGTLAQTPIEFPGHCSDEET
jgi:hypothetical protein